MSAFHRFICGTFLLLALSCFWATSAFAATTYYYYSSSASPTSGTCGLDPKPFCDAHFASINSSNNLQNVGCQTQSNNPNYYYLLTKSKGLTYVNGQPVTVWNDAPPKLIATRNSKICQDGEKFELIGCSATCVPDPCAALKDQEFDGSGECGSFTCPNGGLVVASGSTSYCTKGAPTLSYAPPQLAVNIRNSCAGNYKSHTNNASVEKTLTGVGGGTFYCNAIFKYTGVTGVTAPSKNLNVLSPFSGAIPTDSQGNCDNPEYPIKGIKDGQNVCYPQDDGNNCPVEGEKENSNGVCVGPDDPTYPKESDDPIKPKDDKACPAGQIKNNAGKCVPYADATKCPAGEVRNAAGLCSNDPKANSCPVGQVKNPTTGACGNDPRGTGCQDGSVPDKQGLCADGKASCPAGQVRNGSGTCTPVLNPTGCGDGSTPNASGVCSDGKAACPIGQSRNASGKCVLPQDVESGKSGTASSDCIVPPECAGDPLQCASLEQTWRSTCEQTKALLNISDEDRAAVEESIGMSKSEAGAAKAEIDAQATGFFSDFQSDAQVASTGQCMQDASFPVMGKSLNVPFSKACDFFRFLRILLLFSAYMISAQIIFRGAV